MFSRIVPRVCRQVTCCHPRWMSSNRIVPMFWHRPRRHDVWDPFGSDSLLKPFEDMARMDLFRPRPFYFDNYLRPQEVAEAFRKSEVAEVKYDKKKLEIKLDVSMYKPEELNVTIADDRMVVTGKHEQKKDDHGFISREFRREFVIPENVDPESITSTLSEEGMLMIQGKVKGAEETKERVVNIEMEPKKEES